MKHRFTAGYGGNFSRGETRLGFTLSEVLVAMVLLAIVTQAVYQFYAIGLRSYRRTQISADTVGTIRYLKKLIEDKITFKSNNNFNIYMKKQGFSTISGLKNMMVENLEGANLPLYTELGYSEYLAHNSKNVTDCTMETVLKKLAALGHVYNGEFGGNYIAEITKEAGLVSGSGSAFRFACGTAPVSLLGAGFLDPADSVRVSTSIDASLTAEINAAAVRDISYLLAGASGGAVDMRVDVRKQSSFPARIFTFYAAFDSKQVPAITPGSNMTALDHRFYFVNGTNLFCDDGMLFYEQDENDHFTNHAFYVSTPAADEAEFDSDGNALKQVRYAFSSDKGAGWQFVDDAVISNVESISFLYYGRGGNRIACDKNYWQWHKGDEIYGVEVDVTTRSEDVKENFRMMIEL